MKHVHFNRKYKKKVSFRDKVIHPSIENYGTIPLHFHFAIYLFQKK